MRTWLSRLGEILFRRSRESRLSSEIEHHLDLLAEDHKARGLSDAEARLAAQREFGGADRTRIVHRQQRGLPVLDLLVQDARFALRVLIRDRGFALTAILVLGVGLGVNNLFFTLVYAHKFRGVPIPDVERVMFISTFDDRVSDRPLSLPEFDDLRRAQTTFSDLGAAHVGVATIGDTGRAPDRLEAAYVTANAFPLLGLGPSMGRLPGPDDDRPGGAPVVLLGSDVWRMRYANDPQILGRSVLVNGSAATVIGIVPERSGFPSAAGLWLPLGQMPEFTVDRTVRTLRVYGRLRDGVNEAAARSEIETIFGAFEAAHPDTNRNVRPRVVALNTRLLGTLEGWWQFIFAALIVILVACANVANLMMARALHRVPEIAIRTSLGASRARIVVQLLVEAGVIAGAGAAIGFVISVAGVRWVQSGIPQGILPYWFDYTMDRAVFAALVGASLATIVVFGLVPALHASRTDVNRALKDGGRATTTSLAMRVWTGAFLTVELALAMTLLNQVALAWYLTNQAVPTDANINTTEVLAATVTLPASAYPSAEQRMAFFARLDERLQSRAEISAGSRATLLPGEGGPPRRLQIRGHELPAGAAAPTVLTIDVAPRYFETLAIALMRGRDFTAMDGRPASDVAIVNERFAAVYLDGADPIGTQIAVSATTAPSTASPRWLTIVGVAPVIRQQGLGGVEQHSPAVYVPVAATSPATSTLLVKHRLDPEAAATLLRQEAQAIDPHVALYRIRTLKQAVRDGQWNRHTSAVLADTVTSMSVLVALVGLYAVAAQRVTLKTREIGLRMALGARAVQVARVILAGLRGPLMLGLVLGAAGSMAWDGVFSTGVAGVYASAPSTLLRVSAWIVAAVLVSCAVPLRRAVRTNPLTALRHD
ncbi:MAG TPA: ADOP family duplicated permease [Vicinamibacterales bacterium]|nr:ADOP family duplicated permease [Vicinamibacterales bacterium]